MSPGVIAALAAVVLVAAFVQGTTGVGFALIAAPVVGILRPGLLPVFLLVLMIPLNVYVAWRERDRLDHRGAGWITAGRLAGTLGGIWVLLAVPMDRLNLLIGVSTVLAALAGLAAPAFRPGRGALLVAGVVTGVTETSTGVGGPPLALVYQHQPAAVLRATVAVCFLVGEVISLVLLAATGRATGAQFGTALLLLPALALGALLSRWVHHRLDGRLMRALVLAFALASGVLVMLHG